jgi:hypothetical protein
MTNRQDNTDPFTLHAAKTNEIERLNRMLDNYESGPRSAGAAGEKARREMQSRFEKACDELIPLEEAVMATPMSDVGCMAYKAAVLAHIEETAPPECTAELLLEYARQATALADVVLQKKWISFPAAA